MTPDEIRTLALRNYWSEIESKDPTMISFTKVIGQRPARINVWYGKMTVGTYLTHPKQGKSQLFRKWVSPKLMKQIFENPRVHSGRGYR